MTWKSRVVALHRLAAGDRVGYGGTFSAAAPTLTATVALGYADGFSRRLSNRGTLLVGGTRAPVAGTVSMDFVTVDVTGVPGVEVGDEVVALGRQGEAFIGARRSRRVPRHHRLGGPLRRRAESGAAFQSRPEPQPPVQSGDPRCPLIPSAPARAGWGGC